MHILCIHLDKKVSNANDMGLEHMEGPKEPIKLYFGLQVARLAFIPGNGTEAQGPALAVFTFLRKYPADGVPRGVNCKEDRVGGGIVNQNESRGAYCWKWGVAESRAPEIGGG